MRFPIGLCHSSATVALSCCASLVLLVGTPKAVSSFGNLRPSYRAVVEKPVKRARMRATAAECHDVGR